MKLKKVLGPEVFQPVDNKSFQLPRSPYLLPIKPGQQDLKFVRSRKRVKTLGDNVKGSFTSTQSSALLKPIHKSSHDFNFRLDNSFESESTVKSDRQSELVNKLNEKLKEIKSEDFYSLFNAYFAIFDLVIIHDSEFSRVLMMVKDGIIASMKGHYKAKNKKLKAQVEKLNEVLSGFKDEKKKLIGKLNTLSSENINLINSYEDLFQQFNKMQSYLADDAMGNSSPVKIIQEVNKKNEIIKELRFKINEMNQHENKLMNIIDKINCDGVKIDEIYDETPLKTFLPKKKKKFNVPLIHLEQLEINPND